MTEDKTRRVGVGQGSPGNALTLAYLPLGVLIAILLAGLFSAAFGLGPAPPVISLALLAVLLVSVALLTGQRRAAAPAGTRLTLAHIGLVCLLGGVAAAPPGEFAPLMLWSLAAIGAAAAAIIAVEVWITEKIGAAGPFSRRLVHEAHGVLVLSLAVLLWRSGTVGGWVIAAGLAHYAIAFLALFVASPRGYARPVWRPYLRFGLALALAVALAPLLPASVTAALGVAAIGLAVVDGIFTPALMPRYFK